MALQVARGFFKTIDWENIMPKLLCVFASIACLVSSVPACAQGEGAKFGSRDPRTCASRTSALTAATAKQYFICDSEYTEGPNASGEFIYLVTDVTIQLGSPRAFDGGTDTFGFATNNAIDPAQKVVPIRGNFNAWDCGKIGQIGAEAGKSCHFTPNLHAVGLCFKSSFGDWHCEMTDRGAAREFLPQHAPPTQP